MMQRLCKPHNFHPTNFLEITGRELQKQKSKSQFSTGYLKNLCFVSVLCCADVVNHGRMKRLHGRRRSDSRGVSVFERRYREVALISEERKMEKRSTGLSM